MVKEENGKEKILIIKTGNTEILYNEQYSKILKEEKENLSKVK